MKRKDKALIPKVEAVYNYPHNKGREMFRRLMKFAVLLCAVIGMNILINGILGTNASPTVIILTACYAFSAFYLLFRSVKGLITGTAILIFGMLITMLATGLSLKDVFVGGFIGIVNSVIDVVSSLGYVTIGKLKYEGVSSVGIFMTVSTVTSVIVGLSCRKKTHVLPLIFLSAAICVFYASLGGKISISDAFLLVSAIAAVAVMSVSDYHTGEADRSALVGFTALLLAGAILLSPVANVKAPMGQHGFFADIYADVLNYYDSLYNGGAVGRFSQSHDASASKRSYLGIEMMTVYCNSNRPMYLRTWAGGLFENDSWHVVPYGNEAVTDPYNVTANFLSVGTTTGYSTLELGLVSGGAVIHLKRNHDTLPVPAITSRIPSGCFPNDNDGYNENKYDGIVSLSTMYKGKYTLNSLTCASGDREFAEFLYGYLQYMNGYLGTGKMPSDATGVAWELYRRYGNRLLNGLNTMRKLNYFARNNYYYYENDPYIEAAVLEIFSQYDIEKYYAQTDYISFGGADQNGVISDNGDGYYVLEDYGRAHAADIINIVADYLSDKCKYDTNPKKTDAKSVTEELLFGSKEGYCVQFATVGALIMRRLGFPTRYAEGYVARNFKANSGINKKDGDYRCTVVDKDAHAWCEVWIDGFGWMTCEMTPGISNGNNVTIPPETSNTETTEPITTPEDSSSEIIETSPQVTQTRPPHTDTESTQSPRPEPVTTDEAPKENSGGDIRFAPFAVAAVIILGVGALTSCVIARGKKNKKRLMKLIDRGLRSSTLNSAEIERIGELLTSALARALNAYGILPDPGELPEDYGVRLDNTFKIKDLSVPPSICVEAMSKQIYKGIMNQDEVKTAALTLQALSKNAPLKLGPVKFVWYRLKGDI